MFASMALSAAAIEAMPMPTVPAIPQDTDYAVIEGTITAVQNYIGADGEPVEGKQIVSVEKDGSEWRVILDSNTYAITYGRTNRKAMSAGDSIRVYYNAKSPSLMIYPPQVRAEYIALNFDEALSITIARFDLNFTDPENMLKLNISEDTEIVYEDGKKFEGDVKELVNPSRKLVVIYGLTTRRIPAQTTPEKIIIMYEKAVAPIYMLTDEEKAELAKAFEQADIIVNKTTVKSSYKAFMTDDGILMVPSRVIAQALGYEVTWFHDTKTVRIGMSMSFSIGEDSYYYTYNKMTPVSLGTAPMLKNGIAYVPIDFFMSITVGAPPVLAYYYFTNGALNIELHIPQM
jgi:hypothetical protein